MCLEITTITVANCHEKISNDLILTHNDNIITWFISDT